MPALPGLENPADYRCFSQIIERFEIRRLTKLDLISAPASSSAELK
jgi:hypothetical protein